MCRWRKSEKRSIQLLIFLLIALICLAITTAVVVFSATKQNIQTDILVTYEYNPIKLNYDGVNSTQAVEDTAVVYNSDKTKFKLTGVTPIVSNGTTTNMNDITNSDGAEFYYFEKVSEIQLNVNFNLNVNGSLNSSTTYNSINGVNFDSKKYYISTSTNEYWYDVPNSDFTYLTPTYLTSNCSTGDKSGIINGATDIIISHSVTSLSEAGFKESNITSIVLPNSMSNITSASSSTGVFYNCSNLVNVEIPNSITSIGDYAFRYCSSLTSIVILSGVISIGSSVFQFCSSLTIYCEVSSKPSGWNSNWNYSDGPVYWAGEWSYDENNCPVPN